MSVEHSAASAPAIGISVQCALSEQRQIVFQCFVPMDCAPTELNAALDKVVLASDRQSARLRLPAAQRELEKWEKFAKNAAEDMVRIDAERAAAAESRHQMNTSSGRRNDAGPTAQQLAHETKAAADRAQAETNINRARNEADAVRVEIAELERKLEG